MNHVDPSTSSSTSPPSSEGQLDAFKVGGASPPSAVGVLSPESPLQIPSQYVSEFLSAVRELLTLSIYLVVTGKWQPLGTILRVHLWPPSRARFDAAAKNQRWA